MEGKWNDKILDVKAPEFEALALEVFGFQYEQNPIYREFVNRLGVDPTSVNSIIRIPFLPVRFFQNTVIQSGDFDPGAIFESSGTTNQQRSYHRVRDLALYKDSLLKCFRQFYGPPGQYCIVGLLPSYLERSHSSLVYMAEQLMAASSHPANGFYLDEFEQLLKVLTEMARKGTKTILIGVTFALLDFAAYASRQGYPRGGNLTVIETGGMKGRKREMIRQEVHGYLKKAFHLEAIHAEYGMTELLSQAYAHKDGMFYGPPWMKVVVREEDDPLRIMGADEGEATGAINIIDLANVHSCSFLATDDIGKLYPDGGFEVLGRLDGSDLRGCSLLAV